jgi:hypothetical protein
MRCDSYLTELERETLTSLTGPWVGTWLGIVRARSAHSFSNDPADPPVELGPNSLQGFIVPTAMKLVGEQHLITNDYLDIPCAKPPDQ